MGIEQDIQRLARTLAEAPTDEEAGAALCAALIRRGHGPDATRIALLTLALQMRTLVNGCTSDAREWTDDSRRNVASVVLNLRKTGQRMGLGALVGQLIDDHLGWVALMLKAHREAGVSDPPDTPHGRGFGRIIIQPSGCASVVDTWIDDVDIGEHRQFIAHEPSAYTFRRRDNGSDETRWSITTAPAGVTMGLWIDEAMTPLEIYPATPGGFGFAANEFVAVATTQRGERHIVIVRRTG